ncbi:DnaA inactivator Hda [Oceanisphaera psychrotolerans]|uniref:DnaA regulatory inactivator Hda n=1 Tax=Oceanisphaera psychrotolerans TaxID=1414654 RepID=A0A1J4QI43_9GAMM|nr:DnaA inactivator Hda [Oceanisphaera psychrotolerans]OIN12149.1 DnaA regulatory inactivator Hda [Oceanisphaera psychrotolerans]
MSKDGEEEQQPAQLALAVQLPDDETFASFYPGDNAQLITALKNAAIGQGDEMLYFWGPEGSGRSHLLHASCAEVNASGEAASYIPLDCHRQMSPRLLDGMEQLALVCLDNLDAIAGVEEWERAVFNFFNRRRERASGSLVVSAVSAPRNLGLGLPDLASRLDWGVAYQLKTLDDEGKLSALQLRSELRGFKLPTDVGRFLLNRLSRDMSTLLAALDLLDNASFQAKRKLSIPFAKEILGL